MSRTAKALELKQMSLWEKLTFAFYRQRGFLFAPPLVAMLLITWKRSEHLWVYIAGGGLFLAGFLLRFWSQQHLHYRLKQQKLLTMTGPYTHVRNPIYIGNSLLILGTGVMMELLWFAPILLVYCAVVYGLVVRYEEYHLKKRYGSAYEEFLRHVPRWFPVFSKKPLVPNPSRRELKSLIIPSLKAEYQCFILLLFPLVKEAVTHDWFGIAGRFL